MKPSDPIPVKGFVETSFVDWPGIVCAVIFLPGCNFRCPFCHNASLIETPNQLETIPFNRIMTRLREFSGWIDGVCITGGEPTIHVRLPDLVKQIKEQDFAVKLDTNGSNPVMVEQLIEHDLLDCIAMDIKAPLEKGHYSRLAGRPIDLTAITRSIALISEAPVESIFRMTVVPQLLSEQDILQAAAELGPSNRLVLQQFNPDHSLDHSLRTLTPWPQEKLASLQTNVDNTAGSHTPGCDEAGGLFTQVHTAY